MHDFCRIVHFNEPSHAPWLVFLCHWVSKYNKALFEFLLEHFNKQENKANPSTAENRNGDNENEAPYDERDESESKQNYQVNVQQEQEEKKDQEKQEEQEEKKEQQNKQEEYYEQEEDPEEIHNKQEEHMKEQPKEEKYGEKHEDTSGSETESKYVSVTERIIELEDRIELMSAELNGFGEESERYRLDISLLKQLIQKINTEDSSKDDNNSENDENMDSGINYQPDDHVYTYLPPEESEDMDIVEHPNWKSILDIIDSNLYDVGVSSDYTAGLAAFFLSAFQHNMPILLAGPNAKEIADAVSYAIFGKEAGTLILEKNFQSLELLENTVGFSDVLRVENAISGLFSANIPDIIDYSDKYLFFVHPFAEDILIEPKSLYSYVFPVFTEIFLSRDPLDITTGGIMKEDYVPFKGGNSKKKHLLQIPHLQVSNLVKGRMNIIASEMLGMCGKEERDNFDDSLLFCTLPYAYATGQLSTLLEAIHSQEAIKGKLSKKVIEEIDNFYGTDNE